MKPKIAPFFRNSSKAQKDEETIYRQIDGFNLLWPQLSKTYDLFQRKPGGAIKDQYFVDEAFNLESWDETTSFHELMTLCEEGEIDAIYVSEGDRLLRSRSDALRGRITDIVRENSIKVITPTGEIPNGVLMNITSAFGSEDKRAFMRKCHDAKITRLKEEGRPPTGRMPFCFHWDKRDKKWSLVHDEVVLFKSAVGLSIGKIFEEMPEAVKSLVHLNPDGMTDKAVAESLSRLGFSKHPFYERINLNKLIKSRANRELNSAAIEKMFREDRYRGFLEVSMLDSDVIGSKNKKDCDRKTFKIVVPPVLSDEEWDHLQSKRSRRRKWAVRNQKHDYLCKDILVCSECGIPLAARPRYITRYVRSRKEVVELPPFLYYTCARKPKVSGFRCKSGKHHSVPLIDSLVWDSFSSIIQDPESIKELLAASESNDVRMNRRAEIEKVIAQYQAELDDLASRRKIANRLLASGVTTEDDFTEQLSEINSHRKHLESELRNARQETRALSRLPDMSGIVDEIANLKLSDALTFEQRRSLMLSLVSKIQITNDGALTVILKGGIEWAL